MRYLKNTRKALSLLKNGILDKDSRGNWIVYFSYDWRVISSDEAIFADRAYLKLIRERLVNYKRDKDTVPYAYYRQEIPAVRDLEGNVEDEIEFLLNLIDRKKAVS